MRVMVRGSGWNQFNYLFVFVVVFLLQGDKLIKEQEQELETLQTDISTVFWNEPTLVRSNLLDLHKHYHQQTKMELIKK